MDHKIKDTSRLWLKQSISTKSLGRYFRVLDMEKICPYDYRAHEPCWGLPELSYLGLAFRICPIHEQLAKAFS